MKIFRRRGGSGIPRLCCFKYNESEEGELDEKGNVDESRSTCRLVCAVAFNGRLRLHGLFLGLKWHCFASAMPMSLCCFDVS